MGAVGLSCGVCPVVLPVPSFPHGSVGRSRSVLELNLEFVAPFLLLYPPQQPVRRGEAINDPSACAQPGSPRGCSCWSLGQERVLEQGWERVWDQPALCSLAPQSRTQCSAPAPVLLWHL